MDRTHFFQTAHESLARERPISVNTLLAIAARRAVLTPRLQPLETFVRKYQP